MAGPSLWASLGLNVKPFERGVHDAKHAAKEFGREIKSSLGQAAVGAFTGFSVVEIAKSAIESASHIKDLSEQFRVSTDTIQIWDRAAGRVGMTAEDVGNAMQRLAKSRSEAVGKGDVGAFGAFGIGMADLKNSAVSTQEILERMRAVAEGTPLTDEQDVAGMELMGRSGAKILAVMEQIATLGPIKLMTAEQIAALQEGQDRLKDFLKDLEAGAGMILGKALPAFDRFAAGLVGVGQFMTGKMSWNEARRINVTPDHIDAPKFDLKGRPINRRKSADKVESGLAYSVVATVDLNKDAKEIERARAELAEKIFQNNLKTMTVEERRAALNAEIAEHTKKAVEYEFGEGDQLKALQEKTKAEQLRGELMGIQDAKGKDKLAKYDLTANQQIGAYAAGPEVVLLDVQKKSERHLESIKKDIAKIASGGSLGGGVAF